VGYGTIADKAGLRAGDIILELDSAPVSGLTLVALRSSFRQDGRDRSLMIDRQGTERMVLLRMRSI
jgi:C-terminal processing protease CtpA/Prc